MASSLFFSAYEKLLPLPLLSCSQGSPTGSSSHGVDLPRSGRSDATWRSPDDGRDTLHGNVGDGCRWLASVLDGAPQRNQLPPGHGPGPGSDAPIASIVIAHAEDVYALLAALTRST